MQTNKYTDRQKNPAYHHNQLDKGPSGRYKTTASEHSGIWEEAIFHVVSAVKSSPHFHQCIQAQDYLSPPRASKIHWPPSDTPVVDACIYRVICHLKTVDQRSHVHTFKFLEMLVAFPPSFRYPRFNSSVDKHFDFYGVCRFVSNLVAIRTRSLYSTSFMKAKKVDKRL